MRKWIIIEDEIPQAKKIIDELKERNENYYWIYPSINPFDRRLYSETELQEPQIWIRDRVSLPNIIKAFELSDELILLLDIHLYGIIKDQDEFLGSKEYLGSISTIRVKTKYLIGLTTSKTNPEVIINALESEKLNIDNIRYLKLFFRYVSSGIDELCRTWDELYNRLTLIDYLNYTKKITCADVHDYNNEKKEAHFDALARLLSYKSFKDFISESKISNEPVNQLFYEFIKYFGCKDNRSISLMGILIIAWNVVRRKGFYELDSIFSQIINKLCVEKEQNYFIRDSRLLAEKSTSKQLIESYCKIETFFELIFINNSDSFSCNLKNITIMERRLSFIIDIDYKKFINAVKERFCAILTTSTIEPEGKITSKAFIEVWKEVVYSDTMNGLSSIMLKENLICNNKLDLIFSV